MNILNLFKVSINAVANNKMRSFLSMLGIIIGVAAVIIMMSIGQGSKESIRKELSTMGTNLLTIRPGADMRGGVRQDPSAMQTLKMADYQRIVDEKKFVSYVSPEVTSSGQVILAITIQTVPSTASPPNTSTLSNGNWKKVPTSQMKISARQPKCVWWVPLL